MGTKNNPGKYDCYANAHPDEPMFVLLGRDPEAPALVEEWAAKRFALEGRTPKVLEARACAGAMREWQKRGTNNVRVMVNGTWKEVHPATPLTYEQVVELADMTGTPSVTFKHRGSSGIMSPGGMSLVAQEEMVFNACHTGNA